MCFALLPKALRPLHPNLSKFQFSSFLTFFPKKFQFDDPNLARSSSGWVLGIWNVFRNIISLSKTFLPGYFYDLFTTHYFFWKLSKSGILRSAFIDVEFFGMSSYDPKSSSIEKFETWRTFFICITSSYLP